MSRKIFRTKTALIASMAIITMVFCLIPLQSALAADHPILYLFWGKGCPHCEDERAFLKLLRERYPQLEMRWFEVWDHEEFADLGDSLRKAYDEKIAAVVPLTFLGDQVIVGFRSNAETGVQIETQVKACLQKACGDALDKIAAQPGVKKIRAEAAKNAPQGWELYPAASSQK